MSRISRYLVVACAILFALTSCSMTRNIGVENTLLISNRVIIDGGDSLDISSSELQKYIKQQPSGGLFGWRPMVALYNSGNGSGKGWDKFVKKIGKEPLLFDSTLVEGSESNMLSHMLYKGFYNSAIDDTIETKHQKTTVTYYVHPGRRYKIDTITYDVDNDGIMNLIVENQKESYVKTGDYLSEEQSESESVRLSAIFENSGYYDLTKNYIFFVADTLAGNGTANVEISVRGYTRNSSPLEGRPHNLYHFGDVVISPSLSPRRSDSRYRSAPDNDSVFIAMRDSLLTLWRAQTDTISYDNIKVVKRGIERRGLLREKFLDKINLIKPGALFNRETVEDTYTRFYSLGLFSNVTINLRESDSCVVESDINLQASNLHGYKFNLQGSTNSNGLLGVSPSLSYYYKNLFRGAEVLSVGMMGDFQFKTNSDTRSTELAVSASLDIPEFLLFPGHWFRSKNIPHTEVAVSYNFQDRPEYIRHILAGSYSYTWSYHGKWNLKYTPIRANVVRLSALDEDFYNSLQDPYLRNSYKNHFDIGGSVGFYFGTKDFYMRGNVDLSGNMISLLNGALPKNSSGERTIWGSPYSQYYKAEFAAVYTKTLWGNQSHMIAFRVLGGVGKGYGNSDVMPFEKLFWGGGAYDMRGWQVRTLGPGYAPRDSAFTIPNQTGDIKLEANIEYRFPIAGVLKGALFADVGNIYNFDHRKDDSDDYISYDERGLFKSDFYKHLAFDCGVGIRIDLSFALLRLDLGFKTYDPAGGGWIGPGRWSKSGNFELSFGIGYPF